MHKAGLNIVGEVPRGQGEFTELNPCLDDDVFDRDSQSQYCYHAHRGLPGEHGHVHTFRRQPGMPPGMRPMAHPGGEPWPSGPDALSHRVGISMDAWGDAIGLFTSNRRVTGQACCTAADTTRPLERFCIDHAAPSWPVNRWISALLEARDRAVAAWSVKYAGAGTPAPAPTACGAATLVRCGWLSRQARATRPMVRRMWRPAASAAAHTTPGTAAHPARIRRARPPSTPKGTP